MRKQTNSSRIFEVTKDGGAALLSCLFAALICCVPQSSAQLQITSPTRGTIVNPGQTLSVTVTSSGNAIFTNIGVMGQNPIGLSDVATSLPAEFSLPIPADIALRTYMLTAVAATSAGQNVQSETILVDVERLDLPTSLAALLSSFSFQSLGEQSAHHPHSKIF